MSTTPDPAGPAARPDDAGTPDDETTPGTSAEPVGEPEDEAEPVEVELPADAKVEATDVDVTAAVEGRTRRAPRYQNFLKAGALLGAVVGLFFGGLMLTIPGAKQLDKPGVLFSLLVIAGVCLGMAVAGLLALYSDRRSLGRQTRSRRG